MSVEGESLAFGESAPETRTVDPDDVDWQAIRDEWTGSDGLLTMSQRADAVARMIPEIDNAQQAESLLAAAADQGCIDERDGDYYIDGPDSEPEVDPTDIDWQRVYEEGADGVDQPLPASSRGLTIVMNSALSDEDAALKAFEGAKDRGIIVETKRDGDEVTKPYLADGLEDVTETVPSGSSGGPSSGTPTEASDKTSRSQPATADSKRPDPSEMSRDALEGEVTTLRSDFDDMEKRFDALSNRMGALTKAVFGDDSIPGDVDKSESMLTKFADLRDRVDDHDDKLTIVSSESGSRNTPDERAQGLRMALYEEATNSTEKKAVMDRDQAKYALNGGLNRAQILGAMRRAADGKDANINGSSDLESFGGVEFVKGTGRSNQSKIRMILTEMPAEDLRMIRTTKDTAKGGS